eukprot:scaffold21778_cov131-Isochrysis_galbana.AAC.11
MARSSSVNSGMFSAPARTATAGGQSCGGGSQRCHWPSRGGEGESGKRGEGSTRGMCPFLYSQGERTSRMTGAEGSRGVPGT